MTSHPDIMNARIPRRRWRIAWLLFIGVLVNYFDRVNLAVSQGALFTSFAISATTFGYLSAAYSWTYAVCQIPVGVLLDKFGVGRVGRTSTFLWSVASFWAAVTPTLGGFFGARLLLGVGEAPIFPSNAKAISRWFPTSERSLATASFDSAAKLASGIGVPLIGILLLHVGWRWSFAATGIVSLLYFLLFTLVYCDREEDTKLTEAERLYIVEQDSSIHEYAGPSDSLPIKYLIGQRKVIGLALGFGAYNYVFYLLLTWLPSYLSIALHIDLLHSFIYTGFPWLFATATDLFVGGWLVDALVQRGFKASMVRRSVLIVGTAMGLGIFGAAYAHTATQALIWISISIGGLSAAAPVGWSVPALIAPGGSVGKVSGIANTSSQLSAIAAPILTGHIVAATHSFTLVFGVAAVYLVIGIASYIFLLGSIEPFPVIAET